MISYLGESDLDPIFLFVAQRYGRQEEVPAYRSDVDGLAQLLGVLERTRMDVFYPKLLDKAVHLLIGINKGHFFTNGNKRLALVTTTAFLTLNGKHLKETSKDDYKKLLSDLFPEHTDWTDFPEFTATDFGTYNLSVIIADSGTKGIEHEVLKNRVQIFFSGSVE